MAAKQTKKAGRGKKQDDIMTKTSVRIGKALGRTSFKAEETSRKAKKRVKEIIDKTAAKATATAKCASLAVSGEGDLSKSADFLKQQKGASVDGQLDSLAAGICNYLEENGKTKTTKLLNAMMRQKNSKVAVYAAIGRLAQRGKIVFTAKGATIALA